MNQRETKKAMFDQSKSSRKSGLPILVGVVLTILIGLALWQPWVSAPAKGGNYNVGNEISYGSYVKMVNLPPVQVNNGRLELSLEEIKAKKLIRTEYTKGPVPLPLMAYVAPNGRLVTAVSYCEPCQGSTFTIKGDQLACNTCDTRWDLNTLEGIAGGCPDFPPDELNYAVEGDKVLIPEVEVANWKSRV